MSAFRTSQGGRIDRAKPIRFRFDGRDYVGCAGDTLASALLANGVHLVGRSFKYHRPRGFLSAGAEEPNALVTLDRGAGRVTPNLRATQVELHDGLVAESQNRWPSLESDVGALAQVFSPALKAGFYYKTFIGPRALSVPLWKRLFEPAIRRAAGLGRPPALPDPDHYGSFHEHCDVLVIGAGPAGIAAALAAGRSGARIILCDEQEEIGGSLLADASAIIDGLAATKWLAEKAAELAAMTNVRVLTRTQAFGYFLQNHLALCERVSDRLAAPGNGPRERLWQVRAREVVLATGAIERPLVFPGNDRPGVMLADAARTYLVRYGALVGRRIVVATAHDGAYRAALDFHAAGATIALIADVRESAGGELPALARAAGLRVETGLKIAGTRGRLRVGQVGVASASGREEWLTCDALLMSGGWTPSVHLFSQSRGKLAWDEALQAYVPGRSIQDERSAGACRGAFGLAAALEEGFAAGAAAASRAGHAASPAPPIMVAGDPAQSGGVLGLSGPAKGKAFVDFQNDVTASDVQLAVREGMRSIEHVKRYTTAGMATDQGKTSNLNALSIAAAALGKSIPEVGFTTFRQPYTPVTFGALAGTARGDLFEPVRRTPTHDWAVAHDAVFEDNGQWKRALVFQKAGEDMAAAVARECRQTRASVGMFDASTLGKIEVQGPDAAKFLDIIYTNPIAGLEVGRCRYGLILTEAGFVMDDGVVARLAPDRFHLTTTTGGAARVLHQMEDYIQTEFPQFKCWLTSVTEQWAVIAVQGPKAREMIAPLVEGVDLSPDAMPHMSVREGTFRGVPMRLMRVSFTGELGFEINVPADYGLAAWEALHERGRAFDCVVYGTEAMHVMRAEKGYIIVGQETDGTVTPDDLGLSWALGKRKPDFIGKRSLSRPDMLTANRKQLVGLLTEELGDVLEEGAQIVAGDFPEVGRHALGHVTSSYFSPALGRSIALALVEGGRARMGEKLYSATAASAERHEFVEATVVPPIFLDPKGERLDG